MLKRKFRLRKKSSIQEVFLEGKNYSTKYVAIYILKGPKRYNSHCQGKDKRSFLLGSRKDYDEYVKKGKCPNLEVSKIL